MGGGGADRSSDSSAVHPAARTETTTNTAALRVRAMPYGFTQLFPPMTRVKAAMSSQAAVEGRFLGGRPPYGYQLGDAGPHPNLGKAATGQRLHVLEIDSIAAPVVERIFGEFIKGRGIYAIAEGLTRDGILSPSAHDRDRNSHRSLSGGAWSKAAIRAILKNPRYTGYQVWNKQRRDEELIDVEDVAMGHQTRMRWNDRTDWVWSEQPTHAPIIDLDRFNTVQEIFAGAQRATVRRDRTRRPYVLSGHVTCARCGRRMQGSWNHGRAYYRCKFPVEYAVSEEKHPKTIYVREDALLAPIDRWISKLFDDEHIEETCSALESIAGPDIADRNREADAKRRLKECDAKLAKYRKAIEAGTDPTIVNEWIEEIRLARQAAETSLRSSTSKDNRLTHAQIKAVVTQLQGIVAILTDADPRPQSGLRRAEPIDRVPR